MHDQRDLAGGWILGNDIDDSRVFESRRHSVFDLRTKLLEFNPEMKIALASDHAGFEYKMRIGEVLRDAGHDVLDCGTHINEPVDYPDVIRPAAEAVRDGRVERAIVLGGSGNGEAIVANKVRGIRCTLCWDARTAKWARGHNDANALAIGQRTVTLKLAIEIVRLWLETPFDGGRHRVRVEKIEGQ